MRIRIVPTCVVAFLVLLGGLSTSALAQETPASTSSLRISSGNGITVKQRAAHAKPQPGDACPAATPGYTISPREALNEASIRDWAHNGVVRYQAMLGEILLAGKLAKRDPVEASFWLQCAAQGGDNNAALNLAMQIYHGDGVPQDFGRVFPLAEQSAKAGMGMGQRMLGNLYALGQGVAVNVPEAVKWHTLSAEQGDVEMQAALGYRFLVREGVPVNLGLASKWLARAAEAGHAQAKDNLAIARCRQSPPCKDNTANASTTAETPDTEVLLAAQWKRGHSMTYVYEKSKLRKGGTTTTVSYEVHVVVSKATAQGFELDISLPSLQLPEELAEQLAKDPKASEWLKSAVALSQTMRFHVRTNSHGTIEELINWREVGQGFVKALEALSSAMGGPLPANVRNTLAKLYADEPHTRQTALRDIDFFQRPLGDALTPGEEIHSEGELPTAVFGTLKVMDTYHLTLDAPSKGLATERFQRVFDEVSISTAVDQYVKRIGLFGTTPTRADLARQLNVRDLARYVVDRSTGWLVSGEGIREVGMDKGEALETQMLKVRRK